MWGAQVAVPAQRRTKFLQELHIGHPGTYMQDERTGSDRDMVAKHRY